MLYILSLVGGFALDSVLKAEKFKQQQVYFDVEANDPYLQDAWVNGPRRLI